jgi:hypothetical protein
MAWEMTFPVMMILEAGVWVALTEQDLTTMHRTIIHSMYSGLVVDSDGRAMRVSKVEEDRPAGFWKRLRQGRRHTIPVKVTFDGRLQTVSLDDLKTMLFESLAKRPAMAQRFQGQEKLEVLRREVGVASAFDDVFRLVLEFETIPRELL